MRLKNALLSKQEVTEEIQEKKKNLETNDNENMMTQNLWDLARAVLRRKFISIQAYFKKQEKTSNKQPNLKPKSTRKEEQNPQFIE